MSNQKQRCGSRARPGRAAVTTWSAGLICAFMMHCAQAAEPVAPIRGVVKNEAGKPLAEVKVQVCGMERFSDGAWTRELRLGLMPDFTTDKAGRFVIPLHQSNTAYDLYFDKPGLAPTFLYRISGASNELNIVLKRGITVTGKVRRSAGGKVEPVVGATVELRLPYADLWYQRRTQSDREGRYTFQVTPQPDRGKWQVVFEGKVVQLGVKEGKPVAGPDFEVGAGSGGDEKGSGKKGAAK